MSTVVQDNRPKILVCLSDLHVGSTKGILHPGFVTHEGQEIGLNPLQQWYWEAWQDCWGWMKKVVGDEPWGLVVNGDVIDGNHHGTKEIWSVDEGDHLAAAVELLKPVSQDASAVFIVEGTESHTRNFEHALAKSLAGSGVAVVKETEKAPAWQSLNVRVNGALTVVDHHVTTSMRSYLESSAMSITLGDVRNARSRAGHEVPQVIIRSHRHRFGLYEDGYGLVVFLPAWQALTRFGRKVVPGAIPQCGLVILDWRNVEYTGTPVVHKRLHTVQQASSQVL